MMTSQRILRPLFVLLAASLWTAGAAGLRAADPSASPVSFTNDVMAVLGKAGCNSGPCHGHNSGKGGFKLSLRGGDPMRDYEELVHGALGRRVDKLVPESSLVLGKPSGRLRHGGGKRFEPDSEFYELVHRWITEGAHPDIDTATKLVRIEVTPESLVLEPGRRTQLTVRARFADGTSCDVTRRAVFEPSADGPLEVGADGLITAVREGEAAVLVRYLGAMGLSRVLVVRPKPGFVWPNPPAANFIDKHVYAKLRSIQAAPSEPATDAEFLRRASLDVVGLPPRPAEVREFLADARPDKRSRKIDELIRRDEFGDAWGAYWLELSGTHEGGDSARFKGMWTLSFWLRDAVNRNLPYDQFVRAVIAGKGSSLENPAVTFGLNRAAKTELVPQLFLGVRLECAQCHDHPFDVWKQADYRAFGEFFDDLGYKEGPHDSLGMEGLRFVKAEKFLPWERDKTVRLRLPDGRSVDAPVWRDRRDVLVDWMFGDGRRLTARALVNRVWGKLMGRGIVEPVDDMRFSNPPVNEPLLAALADDFIAHDYDFKHLVRTILNSRAYQAASTSNATNAGEKVNFSHARLRRLSAEQLLDAVAQVTGVDETFPIGPPGIRAAQIPFEKSGSRFLATFGRPEQRKNACTCLRSDEATLSQVLHLVNGETIAGKLGREGSNLSRLLAAQSDDGRLVEELYVLVLNRLPDERERRVARDYLATATNRAEGAEDLMWALLSSQEFLFNH